MSVSSFAGLRPGCLGSLLLFLPLLLHLLLLLLVLLPQLLDLFLDLLPVVLGHNSKLFERRGVKIEEYLPGDIGVEEPGRYLK